MALSGMCAGLVTTRVRATRVAARETAPRPGSRQEHRSWPPPTIGPSRRDRNGEGAHELELWAGMRDSNERHRLSAFRNVLRSLAIEPATWMAVIDLADKARRCGITDEDRPPRFRN